MSAESITCSWGKFTRDEYTRVCIFITKEMPNVRKGGMSSVQVQADQEQAVQEPAVQEPAIQVQADQEPADQEPVVQELTVQEPAVQEPAVQEPAIQVQADQEPSVQEQDLVSQYKTKLTHSVKCARLSCTKPGCMFYFGNFIGKLKRQWCVGHAPDGTMCCEQWAQLRDKEVGSHAPNGTIITVTQWEQLKKKEDAQRRKNSRASFNAIAAILNPMPSERSEEKRHSAVRTLTGMTTRSKANI